MERRHEVASRRVAIVRPLRLLHFVPFGEPEGVRNDKCLSGHDITLDLKGYRSEKLNQVLSARIASR